MMYTSSLSRSPKPPSPPLSSQDICAEVLKGWPVMGCPLCKQNPGFRQKGGGQDPICRCTYGAMEATYLTLCMILHWAGVGCGGRAPPGARCHPTDNRSGHSTQTACLRCWEGTSVEEQLLLGYDAGTVRRSSGESVDAAVASMWEADHRAIHRSTYQNTALCDCQSARCCVMLF